MFYVNLIYFILSNCFVFSILVLGARFPGVCEGGGGVGWGRVLPVAPPTMWGGVLSSGTEPSVLAAVQLLYSTAADLWARWEDKQTNTIQKNIHKCCLNLKVLAQPKIKIKTYILLSSSLRGVLSWFYRSVLSCVGFAGSGVADVPAVFAGGVLRDGAARCQTETSAGRGVFAGISDLSAIRRWQLVQFSLR